MKVLPLLLLRYALVVMTRESKGRGGRINYHRCDSAKKTKLEGMEGGRFVGLLEPPLVTRSITPAVAPFELCYDSTKLLSSQTGYSVPVVDVMLEGGQNWTAFGDNSMARVSRGTACFAFVEMKGRDKGALPAVVIGGLQMESRLVVVDEDKQKLSFSRHLSADGFSCSNFNFSIAA